MQRSDRRRRHRQAYMYYVASRRQQINANIALEISMYREMLHVDTDAMVYYIGGLKSTFVLFFCGRGLPAALQK